MARIGSILGLTAVLAGSPACGGGPPVTELLVRADTDLVRSDPDTPPPGECATLPENVEECEMRLVKLDVEVPGDPGAPSGLTTLVDPTYRDAVEPPLSWGIVAPDDDRTAEVTIVLRGFYGGAEADAEPHLVEKRARVRFVDKEIRLLCMDLEAACVGVTCGEGETCDAGTCKPAAIDSGALPTVRRGEDVPSCPDAWPSRM